MRCGLLHVAGYVLLSGIPFFALADVPRTMPFQAQVKTATNKPVVDPTPFTFSIYPVAKEGTALWSETQTLTPSNGVVAALLGSVTPVPTSISFDQPLWIGIAVDADSEMKPRLPLASVPYALAIPDSSVTDAKVASVAWSKITGVPGGLPPTGPAGGDLSGAYPDPVIGTDTVDSTKLAIDLASLMKVSGGAMASYGARIGIGVLTPGFPLNFAPVLGDKISLWGNSGAHYGLGVQSGLLQIHTDVVNSDVVFGYGSSSAFTERMRVKGSGNVGIGTVAPASKLTVAGIIQSTTGGVKFPDNTVQLTATPASLPPSGPAGGDLSGTYPNPAIGAGKVTDDKITGMAYTKLTGAPANLPPSGPAGGDLAGTYPAPTIGTSKVVTDRIADLAVTDAKITSMAYTKLTGAPASLPPSGLAGGDLAGTYPAPTIGAAVVDNANLASDAASLNKVSGGVLTMLSGKIGIGDTTPFAPLCFANTLGDKIGLYGSSGNHYGFGVQNNKLQIHSDSFISDIVFGYGTSALLTETMRIKGNGRVGIGTTSPLIPLAINNSDTGLNTGFDRSLRLTSLGVETMTIRPDGVGIGTTTPTAMLSVAGDIQSNGGLYVAGGIQSNRGLLVGRDGAPIGPLDVFGHTGNIDQQQTLAPLPGPPTTAFWQSFTPSFSGYLTGVAAYLGTPASPSPWTGTLRIYSGEGTTGTLLHSQAIWGDGENAPQVIELTSPILLKGAELCTMSFTGLVPSLSPGFQYDTPYVGGRCNGVVGGDSDLWFRTYMLGTESASAISVQPMTLNVGIGTTRPKFTLDVVGTMGINNLPVGDRRAVQWDPDNGQFYRLTSSRRYKENIQPLVDDFQKLLQAEPKTYSYIGSPERQEIGYIAEDLDALGLKHLVEYDKEGEPDALRYEQMALYLTEIAKAQKAEIAALKSRNTEMEARLSRLEKLLDARITPTR